MSGIVVEAVASLRDSMLMESKKILAQLRLSNLLAIEHEIYIRSIPFNNTETATALDIENYLNVFDRLAKCVLVGYFDEAEVKDCYHDCFFNCVNSCDVSNYKNILALVGKWK